MPCQAPGEKYFTDARLTPRRPPRTLPGMITWQDRISALRATGLTLAEIGEKIGLTAQSVCDLEAGRSKSPRGDAAVLLDQLYRLRVARNRRRTTYLRRVPF